MIARIVGSLILAAVLAALVALDESTGQPPQTSVPPASNADDSSMKLLKIE